MILLFFDFNISATCYFLTSYFVIFMKEVKRIRRCDIDNRVEVISFIIQNGHQLDQLRGF